MENKASEKLKIGILGASGYVGAELLRLLSHHNSFEVSYIGGDKSAGKTLGEIYPHLALHYPDFVIKSLKDAPADLDVVFLALPHGEACQHISKWLGSNTRIVDLTADFRLPADEYEKVYGVKNPIRDAQEDFVVGIPEFHSDELEGAMQVSVPGCYTTATVLALKPIVNVLGSMFEGSAGSVGSVSSGRIVVDAASGVSGAGKSLTEINAFNNADENFFAYKLGAHRHTPEMENLLGTGEGSILFTPHLAPMNRGILATCYINMSDLDGVDMSGTVSTQSLLACYKNAYADSKFIHILKSESPKTKDTLGSNMAQVHAFYDERTEFIVALAAIDNLGKGAAGQAIQCANLMCGLDEAEGLSCVGLVP